jgi:hypothetical protein
VRKDWNLWIAWFCSENKFGALSLMLVGTQWSFKGQFCHGGGQQAQLFFSGLNILGAMLQAT